jgi:hypothetical protein
MVDEYLEVEVEESGNEFQVLLGCDAKYGFKRRG